MFRDRPHRARAPASEPAVPGCGGRLRGRVSACPGRLRRWRCARGDDTLPHCHPAAVPVSTQNPPSPPPSPAPCGRCFGEDAEHAWGNCGQLAVDAAVVEESHFIVQLRSCCACAQRYLWIFTEFVDWENGEDAQYRRILPVTQAEASAVAAEGSRRPGLPGFAGPRPQVPEGGLAL